MFATRSSRRRGIIYVLLVAISLLLLALSGSGALSDLRAGLGFALTPVQDALTGVTRGVTGLVDTVGEIDRLRADNRALEAENRALEAQNRRIQGLVTTNASLSALLQVRSTLDYRTVAAEVISTGRRRVCDASRSAAALARPRSCRVFANSTIRIPFFAISPTSVIRPTCE